MKAKINKLILVILIFVIVLNITSVCFADNTTITNTMYSTQIEAKTPEQEEEINLMEKISGGFFNLVDWGAGILFYPAKLLVTGVGVAGQAIGSGIAKIMMLTPEDILFNKVPLLDINFFEFNHSENFVKSLRQNVASWYYGIRTLAIVIALCVLIYVGIRMAISTIAEDRAKYKEMLLNWLVGFILIFLLQYIIILTINVNNGLVEIFSKSLTNDSGGNFSTYLETAFWHSFSPTLTVGLASSVIYLILVGVTLSFLFMYIKRLITIAFLIIISPLITVTYAIDKMGDNHSQALNSWLKEFMWNVLIQVFHCLIYLVFASVAIDSMVEQTFASAVFAILCLLFITQAESIVKKIFGIQADSVGKIGSSLALVAGSALAMKGLGSKVSKKAGEIKNTMGGQSSKPKGSLPKVVQPTETTSTSNIRNSGLNNMKSSGISNISKNRTMTPEVSSRIGNFNDQLNSISQKMKNIKDIYNAEGNKTAKVINGVAKPIKTAFKYNGKVGGAIAGATIGAMKGNGGLGEITAGAGIGYSLGSMLGDKVGGITSNRNRNVVQQARLRNQEIKLKDTYDDYQTNKGYDDGDMLRKANSYINLDLNSEVAKQMNTKELEFAKAIQNLKQEYEKANIEDSNDKVIDTIQKIQQEKQMSQQRETEKKIEEEKSEGKTKK